MRRALGWIAASILTLVSSPVLAGITPVPAADEAYDRGDHATANRLWNEACAAGNASGCYELAIVYRDGEGVEADPARMNALYEQACTGTDGRACFNLAIALDPFPEEGRKRRNPGSDKLERANAYYRRGCDAGHAPACYNLGDNTVDGRGLAADMEAGIALMQQACDMPEQVAAKACTGLAFKFDAHEGTPLRADPARSTALFERACALTDGDGCTNAGYHYREGYGVPQNWKRARAYYAVACDDADGLACLHLAPNEFFGGGSAYTKGNIQPEKHRAAGLYQDACDDGLAQGCASLAYLVMRQGKAVDSEAQIRTLLTKALELSPKHWLAAFLRDMVEAGELPNFDTRARRRLGL